MTEHATNTSVLSAGDLLALVEMGHELAAVLDLRTLLPRILSRACSLTDSPDGSVILYDAERDDLYFAEAVGRDASTLLAQWGARREKGIPVDGSKAGQVFTSGRSLKVDALAGDQQHFKEIDAETRRTTASMICVPLVVGTERLGVMQILNRRDGNYTSRDVALLEHFANQAAVALRNATLVEDVLAHMGWYEAQGSGVDPLHLLSTIRRPAHNEELTVMFADMRGYNRLCLVLDRPEQVQRILDEFLTELAGAVLAAGGIVNKFLGDGLLAIFRGADAPERAVRCALQLTSRMESMRDRWDANTSASLDFLDIGIGIATDTVILGSIGTARVRDFTVLGTGVNLAAHLTRDARQGRRILVDKRTFLAVQHLVDANPPEEFELKKPDQPQGRSYRRYCIRRLASGVASTAARAVQQAPAASSTSNRDGTLISYSHKDTAWLDTLKVHLKPHVRRRRLMVWDDTQIKAGADWKAEIENALASAKVAVLMVSPEFLASDFIADEESPTLLSAARGEGLTVIWFALSACAYDQTDLTTYQAAFDPRRPLQSLSPEQQNEALVDICAESAGRSHRGGWGGHGTQGGRD
ncbi:MAG: GAF domain-containing protein [Vicinamibacterales bacterium]